MKIVVLEGNPDMTRGTSHMQKAYELGKSL